MYRRPHRENFICHDAPKMEYDEACLVVKNRLNTTITINGISTSCSMCNFVFWRNLEPKDTGYIARVSDTYHFGFKLPGGSVCKKTHSFKQHAIYRWEAGSECRDIEEIQAPDLAFAPFLIMFGVLIILWVLYKLIKLASNNEHILTLWRTFFRRDEKDKDATESEKSEATTAGTVATTQTSEASNLPVPQVFCVQVFRGLVIMCMILFHGESNRYWLLQSSPWNGVMPADFVYPWFLWGVGAVFYLKYRASLLMGSSRLKVCCNVAVRSVKYIVLGVCLNSFENNDARKVRIPGELQRCAVLHLVIFTVEAALMKTDIVVDKMWQKKVPDRLPQYLIVVVCITVHALITYLLPVPGCPTGYTGPGGVHMHSKHPNCTGGAARYIDSLVFGDHHLTRHPLCELIYKTKVPFDSAGILGTLNCFLTMYSGVYAAGVFVYYSQTKSRLISLTACGLVQSLLGLGLCLFSKEGGVPLNRSLWSISFALLSSGVAFLVLALLHVLVDVTCWWLGSPLFQAGLNTMLLYAGHSLLWYSLPFSWTPVSKRTYSEFIIMDVITIGFWIFVSKLAYKHKKIVLI